MESAPFPHRYRAPVKAVIFDWAGTTLDFGSRAPVAAVMRAFEECKVAISTDQARGPMGMAKREHIQAILDLPEVATRWRDAYGHSPGDDDVSLVYGVFLPIQIKLLPNHAALIPGCLETISYCRRQGILIGSSTGYTRELMEILMPLAREQGYEPDAMICANDVSAGRPAPWMCLENARRLNAYPLEACVKVDDTEVGIEAGLNAGMWTIGIAQTGNLVGLSLDELQKLDDSVRGEMLEQARSQLIQCGAHFVVDSIADVPGVLDQINDRLRHC